MKTLLVIMVVLGFLSELDVTAEAVFKIGVGIGAVLVGIAALLYAHYLWEKR